MRPLNSSGEPRGAGLYGRPLRCTALCLPVPAAGQATARSSAAPKALARPEASFLLHELASGCKALAKKAWSLMRAFASQGCPRAI